MASIYEPERHVRDAALNLECHIYGHAPVQADGRLYGHPLYFRARHSSWSFTLCTNADIDPSALVECGEQGYFDNGEFRGYSVWGDYGTAHEASYMPYDVAERLIRECASRYLADCKEAELGAPADGGRDSVS